MRTPTLVNYFTLTCPADIGGKDSKNLPRGNIFRFLGVELNVQPTLTAPNNIPANLARGSEWGCVAAVRLFANGQDLILSLTGPELLLLNYLLFDGVPPMAETFGDGTTANPSARSTLLIPLWLVGAFRPHDTAIDSTRFQSMTIEIEFSTFTGIAATATGYTVRPTARIFGHEGFHTPRPDDDPIFNSRINKITQVFSGANSAARYELERGQMYHSFLIIPTVSGVETPGIVTSVRLKKGSTVVWELDEAQLVQSQALHTRRGWNVDKTNLGISQLTHAFGTADGTIADVGGAFNQGTLNDNFRELSAKVNALLAELNGKHRQWNPFTSSKHNVRAIYHVVLPTDGYLLDSLNSLEGGEPVLELAISGAATVEVITRTISFIDGGRAAIAA